MKTANFWPTRPQELLLDAALGDEQAAKAAWQKWLAIAEQTEFDVASQRLAPLVYNNLAGYGVEHPYLSVFKGLYRRTWYHNHLLLRRATTVLGYFAQHDVPTMLIKGLPLSLIIYRDMGVRPMNDIDLAVPPDHAALATRLLLEQGWTSDIPIDQIRAEWQTSVSFYARDGMELDLHFSLFHESVNWSDTAPIWRRARTIALGDVLSLTPCAEDQLLHTFTHGLRSNPVPPTRWIADAVRLIRDQAPIDWNMLLDHADTVRLTLVVQRALAYLSARFDCVPVEVFERISRHRSSVPERLEFYFGRTRRSTSQLPFQYMRTDPRRTHLSFVSGFLRFARERWQRDSLTATFGHLLKRAVISGWREFQYARARYQDPPHNRRGHEKRLK